MSSKTTCVCGHPAEWHNEKLLKESPYDHGPKCIGGRCGCSGLKVKAS